MADPRETARLAAVHASLDAAVEILDKVAAGPPIDLLTDGDLSRTAAILRATRERVWHQVRRDLEVLERHELELDESRTTPTT